MYYFAICFLIMLMNFNKVLSFFIMFEAMSLLVLITLVLSHFYYFMLFIIVTVQAMESVLLLSLLINMIFTWKKEVSWSF